MKDIIDMCTKVCASVERMGSPRRAHNPELVPDDLIEKRTAHRTKVITRYDACTIYTFLFKLNAINSYYASR